MNDAGDHQNWIGYSTQTQEKCDKGHFYYSIELVSRVGLSASMHGNTVYDGHDGLYNSMQLNRKESVSLLICQQWTTAQATKQNIFDTRK